MAKVRHRVFEIYETHEEAIRELAVRTDRAAAKSQYPAPVATRALTVTQSEGPTVIRFQSGEAVNSDALPGLREDFAELAELLDRNSKVLVDFTGVTDCPPLLLDVLATFAKKLRTRGSRLVLCCLDESVRRVFFAAG